MAHSKFFTFVIISIFFIMFASNIYAAEKATPKEVYDMVVKASFVLKNLGAKGLEAFMDPKGEFVWKDTYVFVYNCKAGVPAAHPFAHHAVGKKMSEMKDGPQHIFYEVFVKLCAVATENGRWVEYKWPVKGQGKKRKISFIVQVPGQPYQVVAGIYNDNVSLKELNRNIK